MSDGTGMWSEEESWMGKNTGLGGSPGGWWEGGYGERTRLKAELSGTPVDSSGKGDGEGTTATLRC